MKLVVKNLGAIKKKSEIDLTKRFYTFVGYNNSGKTYISQVIWYLFRQFYLDFFPEAKLLNSNNIEELLKDYKIDITTIFQFNDFLKKGVVNYLGLTNENDLSIQINKDILNVEIKAYLHIMSSPKYMNGYYEFSKNKGSNELQAKYYDLENPVSPSLFYENKSYNLFSAYDKYIPSIYSEENGMLNTFLNEVIFYCLFTNIDYKILQKVVFMPSSRTFLPTYYKYLIDGYKKERNVISQIIRQGENYTDKIKKLTQKRHTQAVDELIDKLTELSSKSEIKPFYADLITDLEKLMQGSIGIENVEGIANSEFGFKVASDTDKKTTLEMYQTSTSVNQLTLLYLYLKYWTEESNNFLIIDEPEENLHPENQIKLLDILVKFANRNNNRVLFTTHSPLMAEAVNNHAHITLLRERGEDVEKIIKDHNLTISPNNSANDTLKHSDYATYFFNGEAIKEYPMTDFGVFFRDFKEAEDKVRTTANTLKEYIYNSQNKKENGEKLSE